MAKAPPLAAPSVAQPSAAARAAVQVEATREDPAGRIALLALTYRGPYGDAPQHLPFRRAAMAFMRWQVARGVLTAAHHASRQPMVASGQ